MRISTLWIRLYHKQCFACCWHNPAHHINTLPSNDCLRKKAAPFDEDANIIYDKLCGKGEIYCVVYDGGRFVEQVVPVAGGGNAGTNHRLLEFLDNFLIVNRRGVRWKVAE